MSSKLSEVAIIEAGLGGLAVAIALQRQGIPAQVYEKARELKPIGAGLSLFPNGLIAVNVIAPEISASFL
jgi:salicylate hydroxylase